ncbi:hypothetical protein OCGS_2482 [Oceaniovalibus guishaninsula JLT2003]|uniref:NADH:ubiquinone oxidoreductase intermediate-associated protein 30 domain-containing protein n=1 Tax=Oceaniovalibus guishaninsula JLT2003 TaxID=1231392 RepID=K2HKG2_9RHOB|nr:CIA30 family protein [Oceaniovalibus guishaninsula]EKE43444.1 hypothetical protein OCGS_2482 [Oceaniovalibus guishaninsula JLT2003]
MTRTIDDFDRAADPAEVGTDWELIADRVMGGRSLGTLERGIVQGRMALRMIGDVSLENDGGFVQFARDVAPPPEGAEGLELDVIGNGETYNVHLRTGDVTRPWQSYRQSFDAPPDWRTIRLPFAGFQAHRIDAPLDLTTLRRIGIVAIGRAFRADVALAAIRYV